MRCEICDRLILNNHYKKFIDARTHYLHQTCFDVFSNGGERIKLKRKSTKNIRASSKTKLTRPYESVNLYEYIKP